MNFAFDCVKHKSKPRNDGFYFDVNTPRGHLFIVLDFATHDYANLNPSLQGKLETIVSSFVSVSSFSADLFLGFLAKEINNFVHNLAEQSGGPELSCSAALCLLSADQLSYFLRGDTRISILNNDRLQPLPVERSEADQTAAPELGTENLETPLSDQVHTFLLNDDQVVLVMTQGVAEALDSQELSSVIVDSAGSDSQLLCDSLIKASAASSADRTLVVITGPYAPPVQTGLAELRDSIALLEERLGALTEIERQRSLDVGRRSELSNGNQFEQDFSEQIAELKEYLRTKAATIDLLELDEKVTNLSATLAGKADTAEVLELQRDVLKLGLTNVSAATETVAEPNPSTTAAVASVESVADHFSNPVQTAPSKAARRFTTALLVLLISLAAGFAGGWLASRRARAVPEQWSVRTSGNQITIMRSGAAQSGNVTLTVAQPLKTTGEQTFSSFADVERYLDTITKIEAPSTPASQSSQPNTATLNQAPSAVTEITLKSGDSLKKLAQAYNVAPEKLMELNPGVTRWETVRVGQKIFVPSSPATLTPVAQSSVVPVSADQSTSSESPANTTVVTVGPGDSLNELARRFNTTAQRLKELNPQMNWPRIQSGQKVVVPAPAG